MDGDLVVRWLAGDDLNRCRFSLPTVRFGWDFLLLWMAVLGGISAVVALLLHQLEYWFREAPTNLKFLRQTYRELTILGFMSFVLIMVRDFSTTLTKNQFLLIETAHLLIFATAAALISMGATVAAVLRSSKIRWDNAFAFGLQSIEDKFDALRGSVLTGPRRWREERFLIHKARLWVMRKHFLRRNNLPASFEFSKYLRRSLTRIVLNEMETDWQTWAVLGCVFLIGFAVASAEKEGEGALLDVRTAEEVLFAISASLLGLGMVIFGVIEVCTLRFLSIAGVHQPWRFRNLLEHAKFVHLDEGADILDPSGKLTTDEVRLDAILRECRNHDYLSSSEYRARHSVFDMIDVQHYKEKGVWPCDRSLLVAFAFRVHILAQSYALGFTLVLLAQYQAEAMSSTGAALVLGVFVSHGLQIGMLFPRLLRNYALLRTVTNVDAAGLDHMEGALIYQQESNESVYVLASILHTAWRAEANYQPAHAHEPPRLPPMDQVFAYLDPDGMGAVPARALQSRLEDQPFRHYLKTRRIHMVLRALNCARGFTSDRLAFLVNGMRRLEQSQHAAHAQFRGCFRGLALKCHRCGRKVPAVELTAHPKSCEGAPPEVAAVAHKIAQAARARAGSRHKQRQRRHRGGSQRSRGQSDGGSGRKGGSSFTESGASTSDSLAVPSTGNGPAAFGDDTDDGADSDEADGGSEIMDDNSSIFRVSIARDARFGLLRPFVLRDQE